MAVTQVNVDNYCNYIRQELSRYGSQLATSTQHGNKPDFAKKVKFMLLEAYVSIADHYLDKWDSTTDNNFFTIEEFRNIMQHINAICNSFLWLELEEGEVSGDGDSSSTDDIYEAIWYSVDGTEMIDLFGGPPLVLSSAPGTTYIPESYAGTIYAPNTAAYVAADVNNVFFDASGVPKMITVSDLIDTDLGRVPVKYDDAAPHHIRMIGLIKPEVYSVLTETQKKSISDYMNLWVFYWGVWYDAGSVNKENRTF